MMHNIHSMRHTTHDMTSDIMRHATRDTWQATRGRTCVHGLATQRYIQHAHIPLNGGTDDSTQSARPVTTPGGEAGADAPGTYGQQARQATQATPSMQMTWSMQATQAMKAKQA